METQVSNIYFKYMKYMKSTKTSPFLSSGLPSFHEQGFAKS